MGKLSKILEYAYAGNLEKKRLINGPTFPREVKELLVSEGMNTSTLVSLGVQEALVDGAETRAVIRNVLPTIKVSKYNTMVPTNLSPSGVVSPTAETAIPPILNSSYASGTLDIEKYSTRVGITSEMIEDCQWDIIEAEVKRAGAILENTLNKVGMTELLDGHNASKPADKDPAGSHLELVDLADVKNTLMTKYWGGGGLSFIGHPKAIQYLLDSGSLPVDVVPNKGGKLFGMGVYELITPIDSKTRYWDATDASSHYYGIVLDTNNYAVIGMREDMNVTKQIRDPIHDLTEMVASMRFDVKVINDKAAVRILSK